MSNSKSESMKSRQRKQIPGRVEVSREWLLTNYRYAFPFLPLRLLLRDMEQTKHRLRGTWVPGEPPIIWGRLGCLVIPHTHLFDAMGNGFWSCTRGSHRGVLPCFRTTINEWNSTLFRTETQYWFQRTCTTSKISQSFLRITKDTTDMTLLGIERVTTTRE